MNWRLNPKQREWAISNSRYTVIFDACTLYPAPLRDFLMEMSAMGLFRAKWTNEIHEEWISNLLKNRNDITREKLTRTRDLMNEAVADCLVCDYEPLISSLHLPDKNDRHVLAAAIHCNADAIVTFNLEDFPADALAPYGIEPQHPDDFVYHQFGLNEALFLNAARRCRKRLKNPPLDVDEYLLTLEKCGLPQSVDRLRDYSEVL